MKDINFFVEKAEDIISDLTQIELIDFSFDISKGRIFNPNDVNKEFNSQRLQLQNLGFRTKLMFSEFENGALFLEKANSIDTEDSTDNKPLKQGLINILTEFISFIREYKL